MFTGFKLGAAVATACAAITLCSATVAQAGWQKTVIATDLNAPRGLAFGPDGALYISETGTLDTSGPSVDIRGVTHYFGQTGSISRYAMGVQERIITGLPALIGTNGEGAGPQDIGFSANGTGYVLIGLGTDPTVRANQLGAAPGALNLASLLTFGGSSFADIGAVEVALNPAGGPLDSNPFHMTVLADGFLVTDAGGNSLLKVDDTGAVTVVATFPGRDIGGGFPSDAVPTGVTVGTDGNYYVAQLTGFPFTAGAARIYQVTPTGDVTVAFDGFTMITDIAFDAEGNLLVLQYDDDNMLGPGVGGSLIRIDAMGNRETIWSAGLINPTGLAIGDDGAYYVSIFSDGGSDGQVLRIAAVPEPASWAMLIAGFGIVGSRLRRRRMVAVPA